MELPLPVWTLSLFEAAISGSGPEAVKPSSDDLEWVCTVRLIFRGKYWGD